MDKILQPKGPCIAKLNQFCLDIEALLIARGIPQHRAVGDAMIIARMATTLNENPPEYLETLRYRESLWEIANYFAIPFYFPPEKTKDLIIEAHKKVSFYSIDCMIRYNNLLDILERRDQSYPFPKFEIFSPFIIGGRFAP